MSYSTLPIVGGRFRPPAELVMSSLAIGTPLLLCAEPDNAYDANAVAVWIVSENIPASAHKNLEENLPRFGFELDTFLAQEQWHLGYIPKEIAAQLKATGTVNNDETVAVTFAVDPAGRPRVEFASPVL